MDDYLEILKEWERNTANPVIYEHIDELFPLYDFRRINHNTKNDRWISPLKMDLSRPKNPNREKTVVAKVSFCFHEQGDWDRPVGVIRMLCEQWMLSSTYDVYKEISSRYCLDMPSPAGRSSVSVKDRKQELLNLLEGYFAWILQNNNGRDCRAAYQYLLGRGFKDSEIRSLRFGYVPSWEKVEAHVTSPKYGYTIDELNEVCQVHTESGFVSVGNRHKIAIPYRSGSVIKGFLFRAITPDVQPKYMANIGLNRQSSFFNMPNNVLDKELIIVEGEMDAIMATINGFPNTVAIGGSDISGSRRNQVYDAFCKRTRKMTLCLDLDTDSEGKPNYLKRYKAVRKSLHTIFDVSADFNEVYVVIFPEPCDPDEFLGKYGKEAFQRLLDEAKHWSKYLSEGWEFLQKEH